MDPDKEPKSTAIFDPDTEMHAPHSGPGGRHTAPHDKTNHPAGNASLHIEKTKSSTGIDGTTEARRTPNEAGPMQPIPVTDTEKPKDMSGPLGFLSDQYNQNAASSPFSDATGQVVGEEATPTTDHLAPVPFDSMTEALAIPNLDLLHKIKGMYRLLDLCNDDGSGGIVDKIVIDQDSVSTFANDTCAGSYRSMTQVDFHTLDKATIRPLGIYGSISAIAKFMEELGIIDSETYALLIAPRNENSGVSVPSLKPGIYLLNSQKLDANLYHVIFWPEDTTWQDAVASSVSRNRVTFMRYLTKLCDQLVCLISDEHSANLVWKEAPEVEADTSQEDFESSEAYDRLFEFSVQMTNEEEETATAKPGFSLPHPSITRCSTNPPGYPTGHDPSILDSQLVVGDVSQAILQVSFVPEQLIKKEYSESIYAIFLQAKLREVSSPVIVLGDNLSSSGLQLLLDNGLQSRLPSNLYSQWKLQRQQDVQKMDQDMRNERAWRTEHIQSQSSMLRRSMMFYLVDRAIKFFPTLSNLRHKLLASVLGNDFSSLPDIDEASAITEVTSWLENNVSLMDKRKVDVETSLRTLETSKRSIYKALKYKIRHVCGALVKHPNLDNEELKQMIDLITSKGDFAGNLQAITRNAEGRTSKAGFLRTWVAELAQYIPGPFSTKLPKLDNLEDVDFASFLDQLVAETPAFERVIVEIKAQMLELLSTKIKGFSSLPDEVASTLQYSMELELRERFVHRAKDEKDLAWKALKNQIQENLAIGNSQKPRVPILKIEGLEPDDSRSNSITIRMRLQTTELTPTIACLRYSLHQLEAKEDDVRKSENDNTYIFSPIIRPNSTPTFMLPFDHKIRFMRFIGKSTCLLIRQTENSLKVYLSSVNSLDAVLQRDGYKTQWWLSKVGDNCVFALDETKRLLAIASCHLGSVFINVYTYDTEAKVVSARGGSINITRWYTGNPVFTQAAFITGTEELLLVDDNTSCRIFSLITENFRPTSLVVPEKILEAFSSPDGTCLILSTGTVEATRLQCFHWASFGSNQGIELCESQFIPKHSRISVSSIGHRRITHILSLDAEKQTCQSFLVQTTSKSSDYSVRSEASCFASDKQSSSTVNNSLIDCHAEVWTRFPVHAAYQREISEAAIHSTRSLLFISAATPSQFPSHFTSLIREFETKTRKPTKGLLKQIQITALKNLSPDLLHTVHTLSDVPIGEWLVGMFCLIPIHLAVTSSNRFNPLKNGMLSPEFERSLLGANVVQISQALSFGWYESMFSSYFAKKPVKVVTSMGEQSVGKSFALNHFVDTSFAGSAMRCTEGVWMSVTPTQDYVVVAMDFEGVHSIERSAQEDTLLVLLNAAVSNLVLFRNNFALSRDIAGLFTSFQSSTSVLDTSSNQRLFNGTLAIIIKDVIESDKKEIVDEFRQKFQRIVYQEKADNFITKLHKGRFNIIPWPVIESVSFYEVFGVLKKHLHVKPLTHRHANAFMEDLKMLMAKLKANDWGSLDSNLAVQRAEQLSNLMACALAFGTTDPFIKDPLKNFDTDEIIPGEAENGIFYLQTTANHTDSVFSMSSCLSELRRTSPGYFDRFEKKEDVFFQSLAAYLQSQADIRVSHVRCWLMLNTERFKGNSEVVAMLRRFEDLARELKAGVMLCGSKCSSCGLLCLEHNQHDGLHDCKTSHKCAQICSFVDQHEISDIPSCSVPAGHSGRHVCSNISHLCDEPCQFMSKNGCLKQCSKSTNHDESEGHLCAANLHACGMPCSLVKPDGKPICSRPCVIDCRSDHDRHACDRSMSCPIKCQLCSLSCVNSNHFHALEDDAVHLCGQQHVCTHECQQPGICEIATAPHSIESTFTGKHSTHTYTKYTQKAKRLGCAVPIDPNQVNHQGVHVHSLDSTFHFCEKRCKHCGYYCTLPLGHTQSQHDTSHGSMSQTKWVVEGGEEAILELQGHKYATGDSGAPMLCSMLCKTLGRHVHIDKCRSDGGGNCTDWITHRLFWARSGFKDPYTNTEQAEFDLCDHRCGGEEHDSDVNPGAIASYCVLPLFHPPGNSTKVPAGGHASSDGHAYKCRNPAQMQRAFHIFFALDRSSSMRNSDRRPLANSPATRRIVERADNRFGAVLSSLYGFWTARDAAFRSGSANGSRQDAYTIIPFTSTASASVVNNMTSSPDDLLELMLNREKPRGGTNFNNALQAIRQEMDNSWTTERSPVVVFLSDGQCSVADEIVYDLCRRAVILGKPLSLHAVSFGREDSSQSLRRMVEIASEVYATAPRDPLAPSGDSCTFNSAMSTIQLASTFMTLAVSLKNPRAALSRA